MNNNFLIAILVIVVLAGAGVYLLYGRGNSQPNEETSSTSENTQTNSPSQNTSSTSTENGGPNDFGGEGFGIDAGIDAGVNVNTSALVSFTGNAFSPSQVTVKKGQTVRFVNNSDAEVWPASANHPTHTVYPEDAPGQCLGSAFDSCRGLKPGESWDFTFNEVGTWGFHDHLHSSIRGFVVVTK